MKRIKLKIWCLGAALSSLEGLHGQAFDSPPVGCQPNSGNIATGIYHQQSEATCELTFYQCTAPPNWSVVGYVLAGPGESWNSEDLGGLTDLCNGNTGATSLQNYLLIDSDGNQQSPSYFANLCEQACRGSGLIAGCSCQSNSNNTYITCTTLFNNCPNCAWPGSGSNTECSYPGGEATESAALNSAIANAFLTWNGETVQNAAQLGYSNPFGSADTNTQVGKGAAAGGRVASNIATSVISVTAGDLP